MILLCQVKNPQRFSVAKIGKNGKLEQLIEKPKEPPSNYALIGIYFFKPAIFEMIKRLKPSWREDLEITDSIQPLLENGYKVTRLSKAGGRTPARRKTFSKPTDYSLAN